MNEVKRMTVKDFREKGFLQELNRQFLHPLGLALEVIIDMDEDNKSPDRFGEVWNLQDHPEGIVFLRTEMDKKEFQRKVKYVNKLWAERAGVRTRKFGWMIQPSFLPEPENDPDSGAKSVK